MNKISVKHIIMLQAIIVIYTISGIMAKFASGGTDWLQVLFFLGLDVGFLGIYAILWQQMIKRFPLSVAYANRAMALLWSAVWARLIFGENINGRQMMGIALVMLGTLIVNTEKQEVAENE